MLHAILLAMSALATPAYAQPAEMSCQDTAELHWAIAQSAGANPDAAYENAYASCTASGAR